MDNFFPNKGKKRILVIDDEVGFTRLLRLNLEGTGLYEVREENRGMNGIHAAREFKPDLIMLDIIMPDIDGGQVATQIHECSEMRGTPILFVTAIVTKVEAAVTTGFIGGHPFMPKSVDAEELLASVQKILRPAGQAA